MQAVRYQGYEMPPNKKLPAGEIALLEWPHHPFVRIDTGIAQGTLIGSNYDPLIAKMIAWGETREEAKERLYNALSETTILGVQTNQTFLMQLLETDFFSTGQTFTTTLENHAWVEPQADPDIVAQVNMGPSAGILKPTQSSHDATFKRLKGFRLGA